MVSVRTILLALVLALSPLLGQQVEEYLRGDPGPLDLIRGDGYEQIMLQGLMGDALVGLSPEGRVVSRLADRWEVRGGRLRFHLRPGSRFSDGSPVGPGDVVWTLDTLQADPQASPAKKLALAGCRASVAGDWVEIHSPRPLARVLMELARIPIARRGRPEVGSGPYLPERRGSEWFFRARPHFLAPRIPTLHFRLLGDDQAILTNLRKGWLTLGVPPARPGLSPPATHAQLVQSTHAQILVWSRVGVEPLRALERWRRLAWPEGFLGPRAHPSRGLWPETLGFAPRRLAGPPFRARGQRWELAYPAGDDLVEKALLALRDFARREGVDLILRPMEMGLLVDRLLKGDFSLACAMQVFDAHPWSVLELLERGGPVNFGGWAHPRLARLLPRLTEPGVPAWEELHALWAEAPTSLPLLDLNSVLWVDRRLGVQPGPLGLYLTTPGAAGWTWRP
jgi:hypothetical protein